MKRVRKKPRKVPVVWAVHCRSDGALYADRDDVDRPLTHEDAIAELATANASCDCGGTHRIEPISELPPILSVNDQAPTPPEDPHWDGWGSREQPLGKFLDGFDD